LSEIEAKFGREVAKIVEGRTDSFEEDANKKQEWEQHTSGPIFILLRFLPGHSPLLFPNAADSVQLRDNRGAEILLVLRVSDTRQSC
jgi:hypothetical protein